ncbi:CRISPR/Cas system CSM-associated protein Csm3, group 7 of RAMP superfamily [Cetobacterium ceti]|uniref:CRISPR/Cas system CSM-associated protein Csm3, group 7 of RAMP superfamily n=1 Tax=Cetobacterium ceti TaxID=180163 RepID=A0A1T4NQ02_9FUSO|nr:RAMP superfamily CRISPR-associated protein [Cetobacterium ceti]SJZ81360.1 CRISPR/Cas system CSM-associated protein Csm3, group 7 of RAMP superfamily [Cetobacterium ceti]
MIIKYSVTLNTPAMTGKDGIIGKDLDIITKVDNYGLPYFSASQVKGILKEKVALFSTALNFNFPIKKYFGEEGKVESGMRFSPLTIDSKKYLKYKEFLTDDRSGIRINKASKTTSEGSLFSYEFIRNRLEFNGEIEIFYPLQGENLKFFKSCLERIDTIGGLKSRGLGKVTFKVVETITNNDNLKKKLDIREFKEYSYTLKPMENLILKSQEIGNEITTNNYIHGGTIRGALISLLDREFNVDIEVLIRNLKVSQGLPKDHFVALASIFQSKYPIKNEKTVRVNKLLFKNYEDKVDGKEVKFERYGSPFVNRDFEKLVINKQSEINIAIDSKSRTSEEGKIFNKEILLAKDMEFTGKIFLSEDIVKNLSNRYIYIGKNKSKGFGKCLITFEPVNTKKEKVDIDKLEKLSKEIGSDKKYFTIDFNSDMILPFIDTISIGDKIKELLNLESVVWEESKSFINIISIGGYNQLNKIRKATEFAIGKGGVLTFSTSEFTNILIEKLNFIQKKGVGSRKNEGFGDVEISSKNHLEVK